MAKIHTLSIENFRGIKQFSHKFYKQNFVCLAGRGDSGKSTIVDAISKVLSPYWNLKFYDDDFYNCDTENEIVIEAILYNLPKIFIKEKYGLSLICIDETGKIQEEIQDNSEKAIRVKLTVDQSMEPRWSVFNPRNEEETPLSASARSQLGVYLISDFTDRHFSWGKNTPLSSLLNRIDTDVPVENYDYTKSIKEAFKQNERKDLNDSLNLARTSARKLGIPFGSPSISIDSRSIYLGDNSISLHDGNIPFRMKGKGSKRLWSIAIQDTLAADAGLILIDEVEQGLEPDRVKNLVRGLLTNTSSQTFITTHSQNVIEELEADNIFIVSTVQDQTIITQSDARFSSVYRACPEAIYAKRVIVCEGKTEIGVCRAIDRYRLENNKESMSSMDIVYTLGEGDSFVDRAIKLHTLGLDVCIYCDSDKDDKLSMSKQEIKAKGIKVFDYTKPYSIEKQVFSEVSVDCINKLLFYKSETIGQSNILNAVNLKLINKIQSISILDADEKMREVIGDVSKNNGWFKRIDCGEVLGNHIIEEMKINPKLEICTVVSEIDSWIDEK